MSNRPFDFKELLDSICECYSENVKNLLPKINNFDDDIYSDTGINELKLKAFIKKEKNCYYRSVGRRILAIKGLQKARDSKSDIETNEIWNQIYLSITEIPSNATVSSIGSQGFLSIPLFRFKTDMSRFEFIRLHIWDDSLNQYINSETRKNFSIHSHAFHAQSWILAGSIFNERYSLKKSSKKKEHSLFEIKYNKTLNKVNKHSSNAVNTDSHVILSKVSQEQYFPSSTYEISAGDYHKGGSKSEDGLSATLFSFTAENGSVKNSFVVGPSDIKNSKINRKVHIEPSYLLDKLDKKMNRMQSNQRKMLLDWMRKVHQLEYAHRYESIKWSNRHAWIGYPAFIISILIAFSFRFPWKSMIEGNEYHFYTDHGFYIALFTSFVAILTGYQTFVAPNERSVTHKNTGHHYEKIRHHIEYIITSELEKEERNNKIEQVRKEWNELDAINVSDSNFKKGKDMVKSFHKYPEELSFINDFKNNNS
jgi:hypothetical protein